MLKPKTMEIETSYGPYLPPKLVYREVTFWSEPFLWIKLHRNGQFAATRKITGSYQVCTWVDR